MRDRKQPATVQPRFETRHRMKTCAELRTAPGIKLELGVSFLGERRHLPSVALKPAA
jgi:hypothetical protein